MRREANPSGAYWPRFLLWLLTVGFPHLSFAADFGGAGLLDMPSARMSPDGALSVGSSQQDTEDIYSVTYQAFPRLQGTFRYIVSNPGGKIGSLDDLRDRSFDAKILLARESLSFPAISIGFRDFLGTGVRSSEYLVASKRLGNIDLTLGAGWGRLATRPAVKNPLSALTTENERSFTPDVEESGQLVLSQFFSGSDIGIFGGVSFSFSDKFRFIAEYNSDNYERETRLGTLKDPSPFSFGLGWQPAPGVDLVVSHQLGRDIAVSLSATLDTKIEAPPKPSPAFWSVDEPPERWDASESFKPNTWYARLLFDVERSGLLMLSGDLRDRGRTAWLEVENGTYAYEADAIRKVLTLAELHLPRSVGAVHVILQNDGIAQSHVRYQRRFGRGGQISASSLVDETSLLTVMPPRAMPKNPDFATAYRKPMFNFGLNIGQRLMIMDPDDPLRYQALARINLGADLGRDWYLRSSVAVNIYNDWDTISRSSDSVLPRVRSEIRQYLQKGDTGIDALFLEKRGMLAPNVVYRAYGGILEEMFSGLGGEVLYRPFPSRFALGLNLNYVWQRDFNKRFDHLDYKVLTGHASAYWASPFENYDAAVHVGRYLARDVGATFEVRRTFTNGWMVGGFFTLTDVPFEQFGEGSFDKGLFFRIPFNSLLPGNSRGAYQTIIRTIQRDGGARLEGIGDTLWWEGRGHRPDALTTTRQRMMPQ